MSSAKAAAVGYYRGGWRPIPLQRGSKHPALEELKPYLGRPATLEELGAWSWPGVGIVTGPLSGVLVLDVDGAEGEAELQKHGHPVTPMVRTAGGGLHLYFKHPEHHVRTGIRVAPGLDVKAAGGYVVAPPSVGASGGTYEWIISPEDADLAEPPGWLIELLERERPKGPAGPVGERIPEGRRNKDLVSIAGTMRRRGMGEAEILAALRVANEQRCEPPLEAAEVEKIAASVARYAAQIPVNGHGSTPPPRGYNLTDLGNPARFVARHLTDLGNAERLIDQHGDDLRYVHPWGKWLVWDGTRWRPDDSGEIERRARETVRTIYAEAESADGKDERRAIARHAAGSESRSRIDAMIALARSMVPVAPDDLDGDPWLLNAANSTIDLQTGERRDHRREDLITKQAPVEFDPDAEAPTFEAFVRRILPSEAVRKFLQRAVGYAATGVVREEVLPILYGKGANGKTTLTGVIMDALGGYAMQAAPDLLMIKHRAHPTELADLHGKRFVVCMENEEGRRLAESLVKQLTGREHIRARRMREDFWEFAPTHTVFLGTNHRPEVRGTDHAIWRRIKELPFEVVIPDAEQDTELAEKLREELPGVLAWIVRGCLEYQRNGLQEPAEVKDATKGYKADMDVLAAFFGDRCVIHPKAEVPATPLYRAYQEWCAESGETQATQTRFGGRLKERGFESFTYTAGPNRDRKGWRGIGLRDDRPEDGSGGGDTPPEQTVTADSSTRSSSAKPDQGAHNTPETGANRPRGGQSANNRPHDESSIGAGETRKPADGADSCGPKNDINGLKMYTKSVNPDIGPNYPNRPQTDPEKATNRGNEGDQRDHHDHLPGGNIAPLVRAAFEEERRGPELEELERMGLVEVDGDTVRFTPAGQEFAALRASVRAEGRDPDEDLVIRAEGDEYVVYDLGEGGAA